jgi:hypothetical protein
MGEKDTRAVGLRLVRAQNRQARRHYLLESGKVLCLRCMDDPAGHARDFQQCPEGWHDLFDHLRLFGTRAGIAAMRQSGDGRTAAMSTESERG